MDYFLLPIPNWVFPIILTLMTVRIVQGVIDIVLKIGIKKNQDKLDKAMEEQRKFTVPMGKLR